MRGRRLRTNNLIRSMIRETRVSADSLIYPIFVKEGVNIKDEISSLDNQFHFSIDRVGEIIDSSLKNNVKKFIIFGLPDHKDEEGSEAYNDEGIIQRAVDKIKSEYKDEAYIITDVCMCEYTSHGHCGIIKDGAVDNDKSLKFLSKIALSHVKAGADMVAPSDMMDNRVSAIREKLDDNGYINTPIMSYAVKYSSAFYGPFREAASSAPSFGDRKSYQMDYHNIREALKEAKADEVEGADILMVKPIMSYLDVVRAVKENTNLPVAGYSVSGEYAMIKAGAKLGLIDEYAVMCESAISMYRAGCDILLTYYANEIAQAIKKGDIG